MKTREYIGKLTTGKWTRMTVLAIAAFIVFGYLYSRGVSPVWTAVAIVCFRAVSYTHLTLPTICSV